MTEPEQSDTSAEPVRETVGDTIGSTVGEMASRIATLDTRKASLQVELDLLGVERKSYEARLMEMMETENLSSVHTRENDQPSTMEMSCQDAYREARWLADQPDRDRVKSCERIMGSLGDVLAEVRVLIPPIVAPMTVYLRRELWLSAPNGKEAAIGALRRSGAGPLVTETYNSASASSWMRELPRDDDGMPVFPDGAAGGLGTSERFSIRTRKGT